MVHELGDTPTIFLRRLANSVDAKILLSSETARDFVTTCIILADLLEERNSKSFGLDVEGILIMLEYKISGLPKNKPLPKYNLRNL